MYEPSRAIQSFHIAGVKYWNACTVINELKVGDVLSLVPERDNPHDSNAMAVYFGKVKLGYVPRDCNEPLSVMSFYGHANAFELRVQQVDPKLNPWEQLRVGLYVVDAR